MVKFFLPEGKEENSKKKTDYRIIMYKKLLSVIKSKHLENISKVIKSIKQHHSCNIKVQQQNCESQNKQKYCKISLEVLQNQLKQLKLIKKSQMKILIYYIMMTVLQANNLSILSKLSGITKTNQQIFNQVKNKQFLKKFIHKVIVSPRYKQTIDKLADMRDNINKKKHIIKQKSKQRKSIKLLRKHQLKQQNNQQIYKIQQQNQIQKQQQISQQEMSKQEQSYQKQADVKKLTESQKTQKQQKKQVNKDKQQKRKIVNNFWNKVNNKKSSNVQQKKVTKEPIEEQNKETKNFWKRVNQKSQHKDIQKEVHNHHQNNQKQAKTGNKSFRTQFIKKGRNKIKQEKLLKKENFSKNNRQQKRQKPQPAPKKQNAPHPSWLAKQQQKNNAAIVKFEGKKILL